LIEFLTLRRVFHKASRIYEDRILPDEIYNRPQLMDAERRNYV
jgi:hypothetical protein